MKDLAHDELPVEAADSIGSAVRSADVVCTTTPAAEPVIRRDWLRPGTHLNVVGYNPAGQGEVDAETIRDAIVVVESREAALGAAAAGAVELRHAIERDVITPDHIHAEIGDIVAGRAPGRIDDHQLTLYRSVGVAVQDAAGAAMVLKEAQRRGLGLEAVI